MSNLKLVTAIGYEGGQIVENEDQLAQEILALLHDGNDLDSIRVYMLGPPSTIRFALTTPVA